MTRVERLRLLLTEKKLDAVVVSKPANLRYFSDFRGDSSVLLITQTKLFLVTDSRYTEQAAKEAKGFVIVSHERGLWKKVAELAIELGAQNIGFEGNFLTYGAHAKLTELFGSKVNLKESLALDELRQVKDAEEVEKIKKACEIASLAFAEILDYLRPGISEIDVAAEMEYRMRKRGSGGASFPTIVASGKNSSLPHAIPTEKLLNAGEFVTMDFGATFDGYASDMTRTVFIGKATKRHKQIYQAVQNAQSLGLENIRIGKSGKEVDKIARDYLETQGLARYFGHALGHSLGLEIHEEPRLSRFSTLKSLQKNMLLTCEPGVYIQDFGGVRIEDTVLVGEEPTVLTFGDKNLLEL